MEKHTPGPWKVGEHQSIISRGWAIRIADTSAIAYVLGEKNPEMKANARLIATAPDLLKALKWMTDEFLGHIKFNPNGGDADCYHAYLNQARIIIDKAEGRQP